MEWKILNKLIKSKINGDYVGGNKLSIEYAQDSEREFIVTHNTDIKPVSYFIGRETELKDLRQRIENGHKSVLVSGMGGIGKTQICKKLFEEYFNEKATVTNKPFQHIGYIEYNGDMDSSLKRCLKYKQQASPEQDLEAAWRELEYLASNGKLLLFVDNVNVSMIEDQGLERLVNLPGAIVLTSRRKLFSKEFEPYHIGFLSTKQCRKIYEDILLKYGEKRIAEEEIPDLEYIIDKLAARHTITVEFLAHLVLTKNWTVQKLRSELEKNGFQLEYMDEKDELVNIQKSYESLYDMSVLSEAEQNILEAFSVFPYISLKTEICNQWLLKDAKVSEGKCTLLKLYRKGWLQFDGNQESYALHPVFAQFIYEKCKPKLENHQGLINACKKSLKIPETGSILDCQKFIPFAENIIRKLDMGIDIIQVDFITTFAFLLNYVAQYNKAREMYEKSLQINKQILGEEHPDTAMNYNNLAGVYENLGEYPIAEELYKKSLCINKRVLGEKHPSTAINYNNLAKMYKSLRDYQKAEELYKKSLWINEQVLGSIHPDIATGYNNLAEVYKEQSEYSKAEELLVKSLRINEQVLGQEHPSIATNYSNLAGICTSLGNYQKAKELFERSLRIREQALGEEHPDTTANYNNLAEVHKRLGNYQEAKELFEKSLCINKRILGEESLDTATNYNNLAEIYEREGDYHKAEKLYERSLEISKHILGEEHPSTAISYNNLAVLYKNQGKYCKAEELYKKGLWINKCVLGEEDPSTAISYNNLAGLYASQGDYQEAEKLFEKSLHINKQILGEKHPYVAIIYNNLAEIYENQGEYQKADKLFEKSLRINEQVLGQEHPDTVAGYDNFALVCVRRGEYRRAEELFKKSLFIKQRVMGESHPDTTSSYNNLAYVYTEQGDYKKALSYYFRAYKILESTFRVNHQRMNIVYKNMEKTYNKWNPDGNFKQWLEEKMKK